MKFKITMKDPYGGYEAIQEAAKSEVEKLQGLDAAERESLVDGRVEKIMAITEKWFVYGEYLTVEIDTDAGTARLCEAKEQK